MRYIFVGGPRSGKDAVLYRYPDGTGHVYFPDIEAGTDISRENVALVLIQMTDYQLRGLGEVIEEVR